MRKANANTLSRAARRVRRAVRGLPKAKTPPSLKQLAATLAYDVPRIQAKLERFGVEALSNDELALAQLIAADLERGR